MGRILAIDYGRKKIGMAITDESQTVISTLPQILNNANLWESVHRIITEYNPDLILLGYPSTALDILTNVQKEILDFKTKIFKLTGINTVLQDESYSSEEAGQIYIQNRGGKTTSRKKFKNRKQKIDSLAAHLLIRNYLNIPAE